MSVIGTVTRQLRSMLFPASLRSQLLSRMLLIFAALLIVIGLFQFVFMEQFIYQNKASTIKRQIQSVPVEVWQGVNSSFHHGPANAYFFFPATSVAFINSKGEMNVVSRINPASETVPKLDEDKLVEAMAQPRNAKPIFYVVNDLNNGEQLVVLQAVRTISREVGVVQMSMSTKPMKSELYRQLLLFIGLSLLALIGGLLTFLPAIRRTLVPLSRMVHTVERIDSGKLDERLAENHGQREIDRLSHSFNRMLERLETSFHAEQEAKEQMRRFVADASHELRTPLTSIHGFLEVLLRGAAADEAQLEIALKSMYGESKRINKLVHDLLLLARLDRAPQIRLTPSDLSLIVAEMKPQLLLLAEGRRVDFYIPASAPLMLDSDKIKQVILNLFQNAVQHTDPNEGIIQIGIVRKPNILELSVADNGHGIPEAHIPHLFDRFYRIDTSRARISGGAGLGLSISHAIASLHGGSIEVDSRIGEGSVFRVTLPA
jgi:two-component system OmpR family sensor kinase